MNQAEFERTKKPQELIDWYNKVIESYVYQLNMPRVPPEESAKFILQRVVAATPIDSFLSLAVGFKNVWASTVLTDSFCEVSIPDKASLELWRFSFSELLRSPRGIKFFYDFLSSEFSSENLSFYLECKELEKIFYFDAFIQKATEIYEEFIVIGAPREINIVAPMRQRIISHFDNYRNNNIKLPRNVFAEAVTSVLQLMTTDSYPRFCNSKLFRDLSVEKPEQ